MLAGKIVATGTPSELRAEVGPDATLDEVFTRIAGAETEMGGSYGDVARTRRTARRLG
jgi:ABC-2 type transport system ATP-binding protein